MQPAVMLRCDRRALSIDDFVTAARCDLLKAVAWSRAPPRLAAMYCTPSAPFSVANNLHRASVSRTRKPFAWDSSPRGRRVSSTTRSDPSSSRRAYVSCRTLAQCSISISCSTFAMTATSAFPATDERNSCAVANTRAAPSSKCWLTRFAHRARVTSFGSIA